ncbi:hypothetical protein OROGR_031345 [Orobanche gracilis]
MADEEHPALLLESGNLVEGDYIDDSKKDSHDEALTDIDEAQGNPHHISEVGNDARTANLTRSEGGDDKETSIMTRSEGDDDAKEVIRVTSQGGGEAEHAIPVRTQGVERIRWIPYEEMLVILNGPLQFCKI